MKVRVLTGHHEGLPVWDVAWSGDSMFLVSCAADRSLVVSRRLSYGRVRSAFPRKAQVQSVVEYVQDAVGAAPAPATISGTKEAFVLRAPLCVSLVATNVSTFEQSTYTCTLRLIYSSLVEVSKLHRNAVVSD